MEIIVMMKLVSAAAVLAAAAGAQGAFTFATQGFGDTGGQAYRTSDGSPFYVHSSRDNGSGLPDMSRPLSGAAANIEIEYTSYISHDRLGPTRRSGAPNNASDNFYIAAGVYAPGFTTRSSGLVAFTPGTDLGPVISAGVFSGGSFIAGPAIASGPSPAGAGAEGIFLARFTVRDGVTVQGPRVNLIGGGFNINPALDGAAVPVAGVTGGALALRSYLVADNVDITDAGFELVRGGFGTVDVYDIWLVEVPAPGAIALFGAAGLAGLRRRRA